MLAQAGAFDRFVGIPYADKGRGDAVDCWGLVCRVFLELRGVALPSYAEAYETAEDARAIARLVAGELEPWQPVALGAEQPFDCVLMKECGLPRHIGVVTQPGLMLHVQRGGTSVIERYRAGPLRFRMVGFYRFRTA